MNKPKLMVWFDDVNEKLLNLLSAFDFNFCFSVTFDQYVDYLDYFKSNPKWFVSFYGTEIIKVDDGTRTNKLIGTQDDLIQDAKDTLAELKRDGYYDNLDVKSYTIPYGTLNLKNQDAVQTLSKLFDFIRFDVGNYIPENQWIPSGGMRVYNKDYRANMIGVSCFANMKTRDDLNDLVEAIGVNNSIGVYVFNRTDHLYGDGRDLSSDEFSIRLSTLLKNDEIEIITPRDIMMKG